jgi:hypothetical protein
MRGNAAIAAAVAAGAALASVLALAALFTSLQTAHKPGQAALVPYLAPARSSPPARSLAANPKDPVPDHRAAPARRPLQELVAAPRTVATKRLLHLVVGLMTFATLVEGLAHVGRWRTAAR